jgi:hypothetical protein
VEEPVLLVHVVLHPYAESLDDSMLIQLHRTTAPGVKRMDFAAQDIVSLVIKAPVVIYAGKKHPEE